MSEITYTERQAIRDAWKRHGGGFHGPSVEHASITETGFFAFCAELSRAATPLPPAVTESELVERALAAVKAWDELPGDRLYSPKVVESWMIHHMAPAIYALRAALKQEGEYTAHDGGKT